MPRPPAPVRALVCPVVLLVGGVAVADGAPGVSSARTAGNRVVGQVVFQCKGGVRVQVTKMADRARVDFAGRSQVLPLAVGGGNVRYRNAEFAWVNNGKTAYMQDTRSGRLTVSGCVQVQ